jgi:hypothetical protein
MRLSINKFQFEKIPLLQDITDAEAAAHVQYSMTVLTPALQDFLSTQETRISIIVVSA